MEHRFKLALGLLNIQVFDQAIDRIGYFVMGLILRRLRKGADQNDIHAKFPPARHTANGSNVVKQQFNLFSTLHRIIRY